MKMQGNKKAPNPRTEKKFCSCCNLQTREYLQEFSEVTTLHGVRYVGEPKLHFIERMCWVLAICLCAVFCSLEVAKVWRRWQNSPVIMSFANRPTSVATIPLPALTICPENKVRRSVVDIEKNITAMKKQLTGTLKYDTPEQKLYVEAISMICLNKGTRVFTPLLPAKFAPTQKHIEIIEKIISPRFDDIFAKCYFEGAEIECFKLFRPIMTRYGSCYSFNTLDDIELFSSYQDVSTDEYQRLFMRNSTWNPEEGYDYPRSQNEFPRRAGSYVGPMRGLQVVLKSPSDDLQELCSGEDADTFRVTIQPPMEFPDLVAGNVIQLVPGSKVAISLRPTMVTTADELHDKRYTPTVRGCNFPEDRKLRLFGIYTELNCILECEHKLFRQHLGCQFHFYPLEKKDNITLCPVESTNLQNVGKNITDIFLKTFQTDVEEQLDKEGVAAVCDCLPSCTEYKYDYYVTNTKQDSARESSMLRGDNVAIISMYYEDTKFFNKHRNELHGVTDFIASSGGLLGLYTGFSLMTLVEICYFASLRLACRVRRNRATETQRTEDDVTEHTGL